MDGLIAAAMALVCVVIAASFGHPLSAFKAVVLYLLFLILVKLDK